MTILRPYQEDLIAQIRQELKNGKKSVCAVLGCGGGKSVIAGMIAKYTTDKGNRVLFIVHRQELCDQISETFKSCGVNFNLCKISMVQTLVRHLADESDPKLIITDEAHHCLSESYIKIYKAFPGALKLGFTATPVRMNEGGLGAVFDSLVVSVSTKWLIDNKFLSPYRYFSVKLADASKVKTTAGDYNQGELAQLMEKSTIYGNTIKNYKAYANGKKTIVYCASVKASISTCEVFKQEGILSAHLDGTTPGAERDTVVQAFRDGSVTVLCNVDLFGEGFDVPDCECVILLRPTKSLTLHIQQSMRSMRYKPDKTAIIIDHVGNVFNHGLPSGDREWTLEAKKKKTKGNVNAKECPVCYAVSEPDCEVCPVCGHAFEKKPREIATVKNAEFEEIIENPMFNKPYGEYSKCKTFAELCEFQKAKKFKFGWTMHKADELGIPIPQKYLYMKRMYYDRA